MLELPTDHPRPVIQTFKGAVCSVSLDTSFSRRLKELSRGEGVTLFMTLLAAFKALLYRYTYQADIVVGTPIANRNRTEIEGLIGFFVNTLVLRTDLSGQPSFRQLLARVREVTLGAYAHQDLPFEKLVEELRPERTLTHTPLFQIMFILQNASRETLDLPDLTIEPLHINTDTAKLDLLLSMTETDDGLKGQLEYNTDLFDASTIRRMLGHFQTLLANVVANPDQSLSTLSLMTPAEQAQLAAWNNTDVAYPLNQNVCQLFEAQVKRSPTATAFIFNGQHLTYQALNQQANQVARYLQTIGVKSGEIIGLCLERSLEAVVGLLGILKAGGVYLPLDPAYPQERLAFMLEDAQVQVLLTQEHLAENLPLDKVQVVYLNLDNDAISTQSVENLNTPFDIESLAYVIYTSGSTGQPKGVAVPHKQILNRFAWMWENYPFEVGEVNCQKTALNFVDSIWELFGPLLQGVPSVIIPDAVLRDSFQFIRLLKEYQVTRLWVVPSLLRILLDTFPDLQSQLPKLRFWVTSGEAISKELYRRFEQIMPQAVLVRTRFAASGISPGSYWRAPGQHASLYFR